MHRHSLRAFSVMLLMALFWLEACSRDTPKGAAENAAAQPPTSPVADAKTQTILISGFKYQPDTLTVSAGDTIEWKNADIVPHTATAVNKDFDSGSIPQGGSWKFVAQKKGSFDYLCTLHPNMKAKLVVQ